MRIIFIILILSGVFTKSIQAQKEAYSWFLGYDRLMSFKPGFPIISVTPGAVSTSTNHFFSSSSLSDCFGNLLFTYQLGSRILNSNLDTLDNWWMQYYTNLIGFNVYNNSQIISYGWHSVFLIPKVKSDSIIYTFIPLWYEIHPIYGGGVKHELILVELNTNKNGGLGDVDTAYKVLDSISTFTIVQHANNTDFWLVGIDAFNNGFVSIQFTDTGFSAPIFSPNTAAWSISNSLFSPYTFIKPSPKGDQIAYSYFRNPNTRNPSLGETHDINVYLFDFDRATGLVSNPQNIGINNPSFIWPSDRVSSLEFSPNGRYLYISSRRRSHIFQYDLKISQFNAISIYHPDSLLFFQQTSPLPVPNNLASQGWVNTLQLSPYLNSIFYTFALHTPPTLSLPNNLQPYFMGEIKKPNLPYPFNENNFTKMVIDSLPRSVSNRNYTNPRFPHGLLKTVIYEEACATDTIHFSLSDMNTVDSVHWYFGDSLSSNNFAKGESVSHYFTSPGEYEILTIMFRTKGCLDTIKTPFLAEVAPQSYLPSDTFLCAGDTINYRMPNAVVAAYMWHDTIFGPERTIEAPGLYKLSAYNDCGSFVDSFHIALRDNPKPQLSLNGEVGVCPGDSTALNAAGDFAFQWLWQNGSTDSVYHAKSNDSLLWVIATNECGPGSDTAFVRTDDSVLNIGPDTSICINDYYTIAVPGHLTYDSIKWNSNNTSIIVADTAFATPGNIVLEVFNGCGRLTDTVQIDTVFPLPPAVLANSPVNYCDTGSFTFDATWPGASYTWNNGDTMPTISNPAIGNYWVDITNICGSQRLQLQFRPHPEPQLNLPEDTFRCVGGFFNYVTGLVPMQYDSIFWNNQKSPAPIHPALPGQTVVRLHNACGVFTDTANLKEVAPPNFQLGADTAICPNETVNLIAQGNFTVLDQFQWQDNSTDSVLQITPNQTTTISLTVTNPCGSETKTQQINVHPIPELQLPDSIKFCQGDAPQLSNQLNANDSVLWNNQQFSSQYTVQDSGWVIGEMPNPCELVKDSTYAQMDMPISFQFQERAKAICEGDSLILNANRGRANYQWNTGENTAHITVTAPNRYIVSISNECGTVSDSMILAHINKPIPAQPEAAHLCLGDTINYDLSREFISFAWSDGSSAAQRTFYQSDSLTLKAYNSCGDTLQQSIQFTQFTPEDSIDYQVGQLFNSYSEGSSYEWFLEGNLISTAQRFIPQQEGLYILNYKDQFGCEQSLSYELNLIPQPDCDNWTLYPNPTESGLTINVPGKDLEKANLYNSRGQLIQQYTFETSEGQNYYQINFALSQGIYYLQVELKDCSSVRKFVVQY